MQVRLQTFLLAFRPDLLGGLAAGCSISRQPATRPLTQPCFRAGGATDPNLPAFPRFRGPELSHASRSRLILETRGGGGGGVPGEGRTEWHRCLFEHRMEIECCTPDIGKVFSFQGPLKRPKPCTS